MRFKDEDFKRFAPKIRDLSADSKEVAAAQEQLRRRSLERDLLERKEEAFLNSLAASKDVDVDEAMATLRQWRQRGRDLCRESVIDYIKLHRQIDSHFRRPNIQEWPAVAPQYLGALVRQNDLAGCVTVTRPSGLQFLHSVSAEDWSGVTLVGLGLDSGGGITSLRYEVELYGPSVLTALEASWGLIVPEGSLCGLEVSGTTTVNGFVDNKATRSVTIHPAVHVTQYRSNKPLVEVDRGSEPLLSNIWGHTFANGVDYGITGYVDGTYGLHSIPSIWSKVACAYAYPGHTARVPVQVGDRLVITSLLTVSIDQYSYVLLGDPRPDPTPPRYGGVVFSEPTVTFYADA
jgi:hypothetical protein